ncbi:glycine, alanine and asparagine-rich protein-like [Gossypium australe]|uniref:Glycine, alanine and asparagine-rich protein-like n=1 Tax=Gossypium australe TaxID=47621 RepID=A0A5B6W8X1_9ROSI|nr:glycine, alanine and asparagine-rich protein-like [Gossypium australe]
MELVSDLIDEDSITWKTDTLVNTFSADIAKSIMQIPLARSVHDDFQVWGGEPSRTFSVRSAYKLLQKSTRIPKLHGLEEKLRICEIGRLHNQDDKRTSVTIHFDAAFDQYSSRTASGLVVRDMRGEILASKSILHSNVAEAYAGLQAVRLGISLGLNACEIFGDSRTIIKKC